MLGLAEARAGRLDAADNILTLAGNWSLRDDPSHAWLIERRLRQGDYGSAFAHADTLARRWADGNDRIYNLFTSAVLADQRALPALTTVVGRKPSWRGAYIDYLIKREDGDAVLLALGIALSNSSHGYSTYELSRVYQHWYGENRFEAIRTLRQAVGRPGRLDDLQNGDFTISAEQTLFPFGWSLPPASGISSAAIEDDIRPDEMALRVEYDGYANVIAAEQILMLRPGSHRIIGDVRVETSPDTSRLRWSVSCVETNQPVVISPVSGASADTRSWKRFSFGFTIPAENCQVQRLRLVSDPGDRRATTVAWFDKLRVVAGQIGESEIG
ncbi:hypothetical protein ACIQC9_00415 [Brevundimonas sp. NPDC092305]|uniref:hypothetical protein n=1 Tax=Brevundimonas sp. NPDC092305 TaxID=3363957 RepID=UPI00382EEE65